MDLRAYYEKIRRIAAELKDPDVVIVSRETPDGGKPGMKSDVPRTVAARLIAEEKADLASPEEAAQFRAQVEAEWMATEGAPATTVADALALTSARKPSRKK